MRRGPESSARARVAAFGGDRLVAEAGDHGFEQAALHRVVVDNEHGLGHLNLATLGAVPIWCNVAGLA